MKTTKNYQEEAHLQRCCYLVESVARHAQGLCAELPLNHHPDLTVFHCNCSWAQYVGRSCVVGTDQMQELHLTLLPLDLADLSDCCLCGHERNYVNPCSGSTSTHKTAKCVFVVGWPPETMQYAAKRTTLTPMEPIKTNHH